jgi:predicted phage terminase large subunit-like protein
VLAGRGYGKTRVGAETVRMWARDYSLVNLIGATTDDVRDIMIEGESGILSVCPDHERPTYLPSKRRLEWPNGAKSLLFTADEPERLRGKQHMKLWGDELAAWRYEESWDQAQFGLRLGNNPQAVVTTTPKPTKLVRELVKDPKSYVTRGTSYENRPNLAPAFYSKIISKYEGTRLGRQELNAELLEDNPGALWKLSDIDADRVEAVPQLYRIVVGVDPAVTSKEDSDETGIVIAGAGPAPNGEPYPVHFYILDDVSLIASPDAWAKRVVASMRQHRADRAVAEVNNGGDLVEAVIRHVDPNVPYRAVHATRGKVIRAEPVSALYEQHRVHHAGCFGTLEDQMCNFNPMTDPDSPDRMDALVWAISDLSMGEAEYEETVHAGDEISISSDLDEFDQRIW